MTALPPAARKGLIYALIAMGLAVSAARIALVENDLGNTPFLSANDRSRWAAMAALVHERTSIVDRPQTYKDPSTKKPTLHSIDRVMHFGSDGRLHSYSSKPPLLVWLYSGVYAAVHVITQTDVYRSPLVVGRWTIAASHLLPLGIYYWLMLSTLNRFAKTDFGFVILAVGSVMATPLLPFSVSINNHLPGAIVALLTLLATWRALHGRYAWQWSVVAGLAAGLGVACELPALAWAGAAGLLILAHSPVRAVVGYGGALALVGTLSLIANWTTHGSWKPPYAHRSLGPQMATLTDDKTPQAAERLTLPPLAPALSTDPPPAGPSQAALVTWLQAQGIDPATATIVPSLRSQHWEVRIVDSTTKAIIGRYALVPNATGIVWQIHQWDDWYDYPGTYWARGKATGVDRGEPSRLRYAFHALFGHHGIFSLTPIWLLAVIGCWRWFDRETMPAATGIRDPLATDLTPGQLRATVGLIVAVTVVCFAFYISRPLEDRNYGGVSCCFRWLVWCIPLWTVLAIPGADWCARSRWRITLACLCLAVSVFSAMMAIDNPWQHPWLYRYAAYLGWLGN